MGINTGNHIKNHDEKTEKPVNISKIQDTTIQIKNMIGNTMDDEVQITMHIGNSFSGHEKLQIINEIKKMVNNGETFGHGSEGIIFKIKLLDEDGKDKEYLVAKKKVG